MSRFNEKSEAERLESTIPPSEDDKHVPVHAEYVNRNIPDVKSLNPLSGLSKGQILADVDEFCREKDLGDHVTTMRKGALLAQRPDEFDDIDELDEEDRAPLRHAAAHKWAHPFKLYYAGEWT
jgi:hypothetical protein